MKARVEDDGGRGVAVRFGARFGGDAALRVTWPRFGRWRTNERRRGVEVAIPWKNIWFVFACHATQAFSTKSCRLLWTPILFIFFKSIYSCLLSYILSRSPSMMFNVLCLNHREASVSSKILYIFKHKQRVVPSCSSRLVKSTLS